MANDILYRVLLPLLFAAFVGYRGYCTRKFGRPERDTIKKQPMSLASRLAGLLNLLGLIAVGLYILYPSWIAWAGLPFPPWLRWLGVVVAIGGFGLLHWAQQSLDRNWSDQPRLLQDQTLTTTGPYHWIRHPIYSAFLLLMIAAFLISANWLIGLTWIGATAIEVLSRICYEEEILLEAFGEEYRLYMHHTGRLLPFLID